MNGICIGLVQFIFIQDGNKITREMIQSTFASKFSELSYEKLYFAN